MTYLELLRAGERFLSGQGIGDAHADAWILLEHAAQIDRAHYLLRQTEHCPPDLKEKYEQLIRERARHIPVQYLTNEQEFMGLKFTVDTHVLIPRQDTELLVQETEKELRPHASVLDLCTGSGCIIISLAKRNRIKATGTDLSPEALRIARLNAKTLNADVTFLESDLFAQVQGTYDCIVSNPPYIKSGEISKLMPEVRAHEPRLALDGHADGLYFYRRILERAADYLVPGGRLLFEIGCDQGEAVEQLMRSAGYLKIERKKDLAGLDRVVAGRRR